MLDLFLCLMGLGVYLIFIIIPVIIFYVISSLAFQKVLKRLNYTNHWMAWIPYLNYYAITDCICLSEYVDIFNMRIQSSIFRFWIVACFIVSFVPTVGSFLSFILQVVCLGYCLTRIYASLESKTIEEEQTLGYISGAFPIIAIIKFLMLK